MYTAEKEQSAVAELIVIQDVQIHKVVITVF